MLQLAMQWHQTGDLVKAEAAYRQILIQNPENADVLHLLGVLSSQAGRPDSAVELLLAALRIRPHQPAIFNDLAKTYRILGHWQAAREAFEVAIDLQPHFIDARNNLGALLHEHNDSESALRHLQKALELDANHLESHYNLGCVYLDQSQFKPAIQHFEQVLRQAPEHYGAHYNLANALKQVGDYTWAMEHYQRVIARMPETGSHTAQIFCSVANTYRDQAQMDAAMAYYQQAYQADPQAVYQILQATLLPPVYQSKQDLQQWRNRLEQSITTLAQQPPVFNDPYQAQLPTLFYLAYQGQNDRDLLIKMASVYRLSLPKTRVSEPVTDGRPRVGFVSHFFYDHSVSHYYGGLFGMLEAAGFEVHLFVLANTPRDQVTQSLCERVTASHTLPMDLSLARQEISAQALNLLIYTDIGMEAFSYFLAMTRLAPIQAVLAGHPSTSGIPTLDYYLSSQWFEPPEAAAHYSETLVRLNGMPADYQPPQPPPEAARADFGLSENDHVYLCPMMLYKVHPDFDHAVVGILQRDAQAVIVFYYSPATQLHRVLRERWAKQLTPEQGQRIQFWPWAERERFYQAILMSDVILDTFHFSGVNTALIVLGLGKVMLTWPSSFMRGRFCAGLYDYLGLKGAIAPTQDAYIDLACQLGTDAQVRLQVETEIQARSSALFSQQSGLQALSEWIREQVNV